MTLNGGGGQQCAPTRSHKKTRITIRGTKRDGRDPLKRGTHRDRKNFQWNENWGSGRRGKTRSGREGNPRMKRGISGKMVMFWVQRGEGRKEGGGRIQEGRDLKNKLATRLRKGGGREQWGHRE